MTGDGTTEAPGIPESPARSDDDGTGLLDIPAVAPAARVLREAVSRGWGINVVRLPAGESSLRLLEPVLSTITDLRIFAINLCDATLIGSMHALTSLRVDDELRLPPVDVSRLTRLRSFSGSLRSFPGVVDLPALQKLTASVHSVRHFEGAQAPIRDLAVSLPRRNERIPLLARRSEVQELQLSSMTRLSLSGIEQYEGVRTLGLSRIGVLADLDALLEMPSLGTLALTDVRDVEGTAALDRLPARVEVLRGIGNRAGFAAMHPTVTVLR